MPIYSPSQATKGIIVITPEPKAILTSLVIRCMQAGVFKPFDILAGESPSAEPGAGNLKFETMAIVAQSVIAGTLFIRVTDDTGKQIGYYNAYTGYITLPPVTFDMPNRNYVVTVKTGHIAAGTEIVDDSRVFTITPMYVTVPTNITISAPDSVQVNQTFMTSGTLTRKDTGEVLPFQTVNIYYNSTLIGTVTTMDNGNYVKEDCKIPTAGTYTLKAEFPGSSTYAASVAEKSITAGEVAPPIPLWKVGLVLLAIVGGGAGVYYATGRR